MILNVNISPDAVPQSNLEELDTFKRVYTDPFVQFIVFKQILYFYSILIPLFPIP